MILETPPDLPDRGAAHPTKEAVHPGSVPSQTVTSTIDLDITDGCNLACRYCFKRLDKPNNMSFQTACDAIDWLIMASRGMNRIGVNFMGGEPMLRFKVLKDTVKWGHRRALSANKKLRFSLTSNMTLWNDEIRRWVDQYNIGVLMSIDGHPEVQDSQRPAKDGKPKADIIAKWARSMLKTRPRSDARMTTVPKWVHRLYDSTLYLWEEIGFRNIVLADADYDNWTDEHLETYRQQQQLIADYLFRDFQQGGDKGIAIHSYYMKHLLARRDNNQQTFRKRFPCGAGYNYSMVDHRGDIWPCHRFDGAAQDSGLMMSFRLGNIYEEGYNEKLSNAFQNFDHFATAKQECAACPIDSLCAGFCPAANLEHHKDSIYQPAPAYCRLKQTLYPIVADLYSRMKAHDPERLREKIDAITIGMVEA